MTGSPHWDRGLRFVESARFDLARDAFAEHARLVPDHAWTHAMLAQCNAELGAHELAEAEADEACRLAPNDYWVFEAAAYSAIRGERWEDARTLCRRSIELEPGYPKTRARMASIAFHFHDHAEGLEQADAGLAVDPQHVDCLIMRAFALARLQRFPEARAVVKELLRLAPHHSQAHWIAGEVMRSVTRLHEAERHFVEAARIDPMSSHATQSVEHIRSVLRSPDPPRGWRRAWNRFCDDFDRPSTWLAVALFGIPSLLLMIAQPSDPISRRLFGFTIVAVFVVVVIRRLRRRRSP